MGTSFAAACVGQPPSPPDQAATSEASTTGEAAASTSEGGVSTSGDVEETTELGSSETSVATGSSTSSVDACGDLECPLGEECVDGQCVSCIEPPSCGACRGSETCECPLSDPCCEVGMCLDLCDPILQDCVAGEGCYPNEDLMWICAPDESGPTGIHGDPCEGSAECDPGLVCVNLEAVPDCVEMGCCTEVCDLTDPAGNAQCSGAGQMCAMIYEPGAAPPGLENVGICALPPGG